MNTAKDLTRIPFNKTYVAGQELESIAAVIKTRNFSGPGQQSKACERLISSQSGEGYCALVPSCTAALELSALLLELAAGDEVIMPSYTFVSTATAVVLRGAIPVFVDIDPVTMNLDPASVADAISPRTKAIFVVHYAGVPADMNALKQIAAPRGIAIVEDAAQAYGASRDGQPAGSFGLTSCFSFHGTKNISAGEAGALVVNDPGLIIRAQILRDKGTNRNQFLQEQVPFYTWHDLGSSYTVNEFTAAFLRTQLEKADAITAKRLELWHQYKDSLQGAGDEGHFMLPAPPANVVHNGHIFFLLLQNKELRYDLTDHLAKSGITAAPHYVSLHSSPAGRRFGRSFGDLPNTRRAEDGLLRLPMWNELGGQQERVIDAILGWCKLRKRRVA